MSGDEIKNYLIKVGVETPMYCDFNEIKDKKDNISKHFEQIMLNLGLDLNDDSLKETPRRVAKMYCDEIFSGLDYNNFPKITTIENKMNYNQMLVERNINVSSTCEHHFVIIDGNAFIGYIPDKKIIGLSKLNRIVKFFSKRPQVQERLTEQIYYCLKYILETDDIGVVIKAKHYCVKSRGVEDTNSDTITSKLSGDFMNQVVRSEFFNLINEK